MAAGSIVERSATERFGLKGCAGLALALLTAISAMPVAAAPAADQAAPLERLSTTIGDLKTSLTAIREDLEVMRATTEAGALPALDALCAATPAKPSAEPKLTGREVERLRSERTALKSQIAELEKVLRQARTREVVTALVKRSPVSAIEPAAAAELDVALRPASAPPAPADTGEKVAPRAPADGDADLQLRAELALAQLKIAELTEELQSTRSGQAELEAELRSLRSLTDAKIKHFMGWQ